MTRKLLEKKARVVAYDPLAIPNAKRVLENSVEYAQAVCSALKGAYCCIVLNEWDEFRRLKPGNFLEYMREPNIVDARKLFNPEEFRNLRYVAIGLGTEPS